MDPNAKVTVDGITLTERVWRLLEVSYANVGLPFVRGNKHVTQGGFRAAEGGGESASSGTHDSGDVYDLSLDDIPERLWVPLNTELRSHNSCAWIRSEQYGWTLTGAHLHGVQRDSFYNLSPTAQRQVQKYDLGLDGLSGSSPDPFPRPTQIPFVLSPTTDEETQMIILRKGASVHRLLSGDEMANISAESVAALTAAGVKVVPIPLADWPALEAAFGRNGE